MRGVSNPKAKGYYKNIIDEKKEFDRKVRTVLRGITVFFNHLELLNILKYRFFSYQFFSHKLLRWLVPWFLIFAFIANAILTFDIFFYIYIFIFQVLFYLGAFLGMTKSTWAEYFIFKIPLYFIRVNWSIFVAWIKYIKGDRILMWQPSER